MSEQEKTFTQAEVDQIVKDRLAREKEKWSKSGEVGELRARLEEKDREVAEMKRSHLLDETRRAAVEELKRRQVDEGRWERVLRLLDLEGIADDESGTPRREQVLRQIDSVASEIPELVRRRGAGSGGSSKPVIEQEKPLSREELEGMDEDAINSNWDRVKAFLAGER